MTNNPVTEKKALILDRDGVININKGYVHRVEEFEFIPGIFTVCRAFVAAGYLVIVVTNQSGIGRGYYDDAQFHILTRYMLDRFAEQGAPIDQVYYCPHHPKFGIGSYQIDCACRKPKPGMIQQAQIDFRLDLSGSILIGDSERDIEAGINAGVGVTCLYEPITKNITKADYIFYRIEEATNLL
ncbi:MAG: D-glycero-beta-D-manno-heptose-1,7-bisphosphate 7-phosphatase [Candidatus Cloacimonetes bacterium 4572_55]|nr:MAG: D-glycero-beta-D-manno-heptose-1,7-bisphosphate 7-phosphatase [Candidatus Cloacimonetes bacterium 4572_55]